MAFQSPTRVRLRTSLSTRIVYTDSLVSPPSSPLNSLQSTPAFSYEPTTPASSPMSIPYSTQRNPKSQVTAAQFPGLSSSEAAILLSKCSTTDKFYTLARKLRGSISEEKSEAMMALVYKGMEARYRSSEQAEIHAISQNLRSVEAYVAFEELLSTDWQFREWRGVGWVFNNALTLVQQEWNAHVVGDRLPGLQRRYEEALDKLAGEVAQAIAEWRVMKDGFEGRYGVLERELEYESLG